MSGATCGVSDWCDAGPRMSLRSSGLRACEPPGLDQACVQAAGVRRGPESGRLGRCLGGGPHERERHGGWRLGNAAPGCRFAHPGYEPVPTALLARKRRRGGLSHRLGQPTPKYNISPGRELLTNVEPFPRLRGLTGIRVSIQGDDHVGVCDLHDRTPRFRS
jgi:hypothetical protein